MSSGKMAAILSGSPCVKLPSFSGKRQDVDLLVDWPWRLQRSTTRLQWPLSWRFTTAQKISHHFKSVGCTTRSHGIIKWEHTVIAPWDNLKSSNDSKNCWIINICDICKCMYIRNDVQSYQVIIIHNLFLSPCSWKSNAVDSWGKQRRMQSYKILLPDVEWIQGSIMVLYECLLNGFR